jgi:signal transduction histidine kinase
MSLNARETMDKMSDIVWMIKPGESENISLKQRIEQFAYDLSSSQGIDIDIDLSILEKEKLTNDQRRNIYLIFKEAINNAMKYSGTEKLDILATSKDGYLKLQIRDYGSGMNLDGKRSGNGLTNMEKRAREIGGSLVIESAPGQGTSIELISPL